MSPEYRRLRPIPLGPGTGRGGASRCQLQVLVPDRNHPPDSAPMEKWVCPLPSPAKQSWRTCGPFCLDWAFPRSLKRISLFCLILGSLCLPFHLFSLLSQSQASDVVIVSSKYKQRYECRLPAGAIHFQREREEEAPAYQGPGIPELLSPMRDAPCLLKVKGTGMYGMRAWVLTLSENQSARE